MTVAGTSLPAPWARSVTVEVVTVAGSMGSSKVTVTFVPTATSVAPGAGVRPVMLGRIGVAPTRCTGSVTDDRVGVTSPVDDVAST